MVRAAAQFLVGILASLLVCELLFRVLPVSTSTLTGYYIDPEILTYPPQHQWQVATGWDLRNPRTLHSNNFGFVSAHDFVRDETAIALIGDSYVESSMLAASDRPGAQLERALGGSRPVYAMGNPGTALLDYAERIRFAHQHFGTRDFVVLMERGDVRQSLCGSGNIDSPCLDAKTLAARNERHPPASPVKRVLRNVALAQYFSGQLKIEPSRLLSVLFHSSPAAVQVATAAASGSGPAPTLDDATRRRVDAVTEAFFARAKTHVAGRLVIVVDCDRPGLQAGRDIRDPARARFIQLARSAGAEVIDTEPLYRQHFETSNLSLDVSPHDGHLNPLGVALVAQAVASVLREPRR